MPFQQGAFRFNNAVGLTIPGKVTAIEDESRFELRHPIVKIPVAIERVTHDEMKPRRIDAGEKKRSTTFPSATAGRSPTSIPWRFFAIGNPPAWLSVRRQVQGASRAKAGDCLPLR